MRQTSYGFMDTHEKLLRLIKNQSELSRTTGISQSEINKMVKGERRLYLDVGFKIARALGVSLDYLADESIKELPLPEVSPEEKTLIDMVRVLGIEEARRRLLQAPREDIEFIGRGHYSDAVKDQKNRRVISRTRKTGGG